MSKKAIKKNERKSANRCGHRYCTDCTSKRGRNRGRRRDRYAARRAGTRPVQEGEQP